MIIEDKISKQLNLSFDSVKQVLIMNQEEGATVPFMARYRKERTENLDEVEISSILNLFNKIEELEKRKASILKVIDSQNKLSEQLKTRIQNCQDIQILEDIYLPYKPKKLTKGQKAINCGLEPLANAILADTPINQIDLTTYEDKENYKDQEAVLAGVCSILGERINEEAPVRSSLRLTFSEQSHFQAKVISSKKEEAQKFEDYFNFDQSIKRIPSHRVLAILRGVGEGYLRLKIQPEEEKALKVIDQNSNIQIKKNRDFLKTCQKDAYKRLLKPSLETELKNSLKFNADTKAIEVFTSNLKELLLASPLGNKATLAIDPGIRTGCKVVILNREGKLLDHDVIFPIPPFSKIDQSKKILLRFIKEYNIEAIAVGNGTGGRETLSFCQGLGLIIPIVMVSESGASIYSASEVARKEFPDKDVTVRGAVSIGRRLMDPLAELVKIDPRSIGVGQYQHDVDQKRLKASLDEVVINCVNHVGVDVNTASSELLSYVSGLNKKISDSLVAYRDENGPFKSRRDILKVKGLGPKSFEQASGFLRIRSGKMPLDNTGIHPERYGLIQQMADDLSVDLKSLIQNKDLLKRINLERYKSKECGIETLKDIIKELSEPGRDPREEFIPFQFSDEVNEIGDLYENMILPGIITNVTDFGAFADIGVHQDGLVHISELCDHFVQNPSEIVKVNQKVELRVLKVDIQRKRISLSMRGLN